MRSLSRSLFLEADVGVPTSIEPAGTPLENPYVFDSVARELKGMAHEGLLRVIQEDHAEGGPDTLIARMTFERLR